MAKTSGNKGRNRKVVSYQKKKKRKFDWFFLVFAAILVYLVVQVMHFADNDDIALFEVKTSEKISTNRYYSGLITREEYVYTADHAGYINFYVTNGRKASAGATIYTLDETGNFSQLLIAASNDGTDLARDSLLRLKDKMVEFSTEFQPIDFKDVYTVKNTIVVSVLDALNEEALQQLADSASQDAFFKVSTDQSGFVLYQSDQYDGADNDTLQVSDLIQHVAETKITQAGSYVEQDAFVYKLVKDDQFSVHFLLSEDEMNRFGKNLSYTEGTRQSVYFEQLEQTLQGKMYLELLGDGTVCARIDFTSMGSNFLNNRFVEFELVDENMIGLKIPSSAVTEKQFFMVPAAYQSVNNSGRVVFFKEAVDSEGNAHTLTGSTFVQLEMSSDRTLRQSAYENLYGTYDTFQNTMAGLFAANIKQASFFARSRKFASTRAYYLHDSNIPERVYDNLIETIHQNMDVMHRYVSLRKKMLGVDELHMYDVYVPLLAEFDKKYSFAEAQKMVKEGLQPLGEEYATLLDRAFTERWIDRYENEGKRGGAYSWGSYDTTPYVLMNYDHTLDSVFTLAHELGHSMHSYYSCSNQPYAYADYKIFVAEVASTCNEALLIRHLLAQCTDIQERAHLINHFLESFKGTVYRQTMFAEFEMICHRKVEAGETLTADGLKALYKDLNAQYFGTDMVTDDAIAMEWARIPHFYTPFYVYQYATGFSAAIALSERILTEGEPALADYKAFLKTGGSMDPIEELRIAGVDMEQPQPIKKALDLFAELVTEMEQICEQL